MTSIASPLWRNLQAYQIYGANTNVGKTVVSTLLCRAASKRRKDAASALRGGRKGGVGFLKPVSTGPLGEADDRHIQKFAPATITRCLYQFKEPVSPHIAAADSTHVPSDDELACGIHGVLSRWENDGLSHAFVETAGGVHSPGPSGTSQADLYRPLRLPVVLVADYHLGGISASISAYESLHIRGYDVQSVLMFKDEYYKNSDYLLEYFGNKDIPLLAFGEPPARPQDGSEASLREDEQRMARYYDASCQDNDGLNGLMSELETRHFSRLDKLDSMASRAHKSVWYPFTQHKDLKPEALTVIDSAKGDHFQVYNRGNSDNPRGSNSLVGPVFDGSASWWTQGLGHGNPELALGAAYAAGRYGHVMFALGAHEPAIELAETVLRHGGNARLSRAFYSDNGSTAMEVAVKMAIRAACDRYGWDGRQEEIGILGLKGSYHGDTIGTMDCSEPSTFNKAVEWYRGRGYWFDYPTIKMVDGKWIVDLPEDMKRAPLGDNVAIHETEGKSTKFDLRSAFDLESRDHRTLAFYKDYLRVTIEELVNSGRKFGALILEPIVLGAGGMQLVDPLFQHAMIQVVRENPNIFGQRVANESSPDVIAANSSTAGWSGLPVVFDEVFTGLYRLLHSSPTRLFPASSHPDIAVNAKLLTGGLIPLAMTLASEEIFTVFNSSPKKEQALLHGHSYTAHPIGCHVACLSVRKMQAMESAGAWDDFKADWGVAGVRGRATDAQRGEDTVAGETAGKPDIWSVWPHSLLERLTTSKAVESAWAMGTVLAVTLTDESGGGGYSSSVAQDLQKKLRMPEFGTDGQALTPGAAEIPFGVQSRVLGNVFYLMSSLTSRKAEIDRICGMLEKALC